MAGKITAFRIAKYIIASFVAEIARNRQKIAQEIAEQSQNTFLGRRKEIAAFPRFQDRSAFGTPGV